MVTAAVLIRRSELSADRRRMYRQIDGSEIGRSSDSLSADEREECRQIVALRSIARRRLLTAHENRKPADRQKAKLANPRGAWMTSDAHARTGPRCSGLSPALRWNVPGIEGDQPAHRHDHVRAVFQMTRRGGDHRDRADAADHGEQRVERRGRGGAGDQRSRQIETRRLRQRADLHFVPARTTPGHIAAQIPDHFRLHDHLSLDGCARRRGLSPPFAAHRVRSAVPTRHHPGGARISSLEERAEYRDAVKRATAGVRYLRLPRATCEIALKVCSSQEISGGGGW